MNTKINDIRSNSKSPIKEKRRNDLRNSINKEGKHLIDESPQKTLNDIN